MSESTKARKAQESTAEQTAHQGDVVTSAAGENATAAVVTAEEPHAFVYLGPNLPKGLLKNGAIFNGTRSAVLKHLEGATAAYPEVAQLLVTSDMLAESMRRIQDGGNLLASNYAKLASKIKNK